MRVYYNDNSFIDFKNATHWNYEAEDWVELLDEKDNIVAVLNWRLVWLLKILPSES